MKEELRKNDAEARAKATARTAKLIAGWAESSVEEAFYLADHGDKRVAWSNLAEIADHITGTLSMDLPELVTDMVTEILNEEFAFEAAQND